jgi:hypothetical protein
MWKVTLSWGRNLVRLKSLRLQVGAAIGLTSLFEFRFALVGVFATVGARFTVFV